MAFYVRAINIENWPVNTDVTEIRELSSDTLSDLRTKGQELSFWYAETEAEIDGAVLAFLGSADRWAKGGKTEEQDIIAIEASLIETAGIELQQENNHTDIIGYENRHYNFKQLTIGSLEVLVSAIIESIKRGKAYIYDSSKITELFTLAVNNGLISQESIAENHKDLRKLITSIISNA